MENHGNIMAQLADLRKWHEEHCAGGEESGNSTVFLPSADQAKLYQILGLSPSFIQEIEVSQTQGTPGNRNSVQEVLNNSVSPAKSPPIQNHPDPVGQLKINNNLSGPDPQGTSKPVVKRPFLKRGEGLTNRFKIHPDRYKLKNLPKYKFKANPSPKAIPPEDVVVEECVPEEPPQDTPFKYDVDRMRKSCLKTESLVHVEELRAKMTRLCTEAINDDSGELLAVQQTVEDNAKRMLDFSRKSPRVTFHSEVTKIPFENYFHLDVNRNLQEEEPNLPDEGSSDDEDDAVAAESLHCEFNIDKAFNAHAVISTPVDIFKERHQLNLQPVARQDTEKSPRSALLEKGSLLREKIKELEDETQNFREQNRQLQKIRQTLELEKVQLAKQRTDLERAFKDQQVNMEIEFKARREEMEEKISKIEKRSAVPNKKFKEETKQLQDKIEELEKEIKNREVKHGAAQTRLRCHIRTLEKETKEQSTTIEALKKENKRLEAENARLQRQKNNKMLSEINRNIAKLGTSNPSEVPDKPDNALVTKPKRLSAEAQPKKPISVASKEVVQRSSYESQSSVQTVDEEDSDSDGDHEVAGPPSTYFPSVQSYKQKCRDREEPANDAGKENLQPMATHFNETTNGLKREIVNPDGSKDVIYPNGNLKKVSADGMKIKMLFFNKDIKESDIHAGTVKYYYAETKTWHTSYLDGLEVLEFPSGQTEHRHKDGRIEIHFPNGTIRTTNPKDKEVLEEWKYPDGSIVLETKSQEKIIKLANGQKEVHTKDHKRREYPDGTVKIVYNDGRTETRYSNGRVRIKDKDGQLISDSQNLT